MSNINKLDVLLDFSETKNVKKFINSHETGMYCGKNVDGEDVIVKISKGIGMEVETLQSNGWWVIHEYDENGIFVSEDFRKA